MSRRMYKVLFNLLLDPKNEHKNWQKFVLFNYHSLKNEWIIPKNKYTEKNLFYLTIIPKNEYKNEYKNLLLLSSPIPFYATWK